MQTILLAIIPVFLRELFAGFFGARRDARLDASRDQSMHDLGAARAEAQGRSVIQEIADDQLERSADRLDRDGAVKRLRDGTG